MFYINKPRLQRHTDGLSDQARQVRNLRYELRAIDFSDQPEAAYVKTRCLRRLDKIQEVLNRAQVALTEYEESYDGYINRLDTELEELVADVSLLF